MTEAVGHLDCTRFAGRIECSKNTAATIVQVIVIRRVRGVAPLYALANDIEVYGGSDEGEGEETRLSPA